MRIHIGIFEDDEDLADHFKELFSELDYEVSTFYSTQNIPWEKLDVVLADYNNKIVPFKQAVKLCNENETPVIAISGGTMKFEPKLQKPFSIEELQSTVMKAISKKEEEKEPSFFSEVLSKLLPK